ncbi:limonene-1,2-epoxide hydrolase family protein [Mycolicibacterium neworleansense]|uniref:Limonene-1,2-epoxide hydrolase n=1 Tax=Mycolicibacterium neworleansense TaxID=146018 RepID=A0A0H5RXG6_9MYCO|nr:limonene-1,2-epoxide hydrolase family protein [Mycolicibacterium neworleansense]MCV7360763.1 nuclear transport factor 2 family protein [Mycolicibacterium neworleansense]CRZ18232.1 limonene-1,2-epoxide hydrolase [Mycolicibacterium neworleansense]
MTPEQSVRAELEAWSTLDVEQIVAPFAPDAVWVAQSTVTLRGIEEIRVAVTDWVARITFAELRLVNIATNGDVVLTERVDAFTFTDGKKIELPVMGAFEVADGKITGWRDYYDPGAHG